MRSTDPFAFFDPPLDPLARPELILACTIVMLAVTAVGFFSDHLPLWLAGLPLVLAIVSGLAIVRAIAMAAYMLWPAVIIIDGLIATGLLPEGAQGIAVPAAVGFGAIAALVAITPLALFVSLIAVFPASPLLVIADVVPGTGLAGPLVVMFAFLTAEALPVAAWRTLAVGLIATALTAWNPGIHPSTGPQEQAPAPAQARWKPLPVPATITEYAGRLALRDSLPEGSKVIMGENVFHASDRQAVDFWCDGVQSRNLTLWTGVFADTAPVPHGQVWRFDAQACAQHPPQPARVHAARYGVPGITGTWGRIEANSRDEAGPDRYKDTSPYTGANADLDVDWLICLEAFLPAAWTDVLSRTDTTRPVVVLANDRPFDALPVAVLRRKVARTMAGLTGRTVLFAQTGHTVLVSEP